MIAEAAKAIKDAEYLLITAGAGMGVDSGLPDFRGVEGFWRAYPVAKRLGLRFEELANPRWFEEDPHLAWAFYGHRLHLYRDTTPHSGFAKLLAIAKSKKDYFVLTSNVDGQFQKAGFDEEKIDEVHGSIHYMQCSVPCNQVIWSAENVEIVIDEEHFLAKDPLPRCPQCQAIARPNILMFGDWRWIESREEEQRKRLETFLQKVDGKLTILEFGAGTAVPTIRIMGERIAQSFDATLIRINPRESEGADISLAMGAKEAIEKIGQYV
ncbi:SIR2 family NAD-dependent protein deacylase [Nitratiruptor tergarcus]|uniref:protein acetyllysine N-acetyltransferase n=1 Tax=Nitratiruptor tergarcus DSM 16512 TaxID=1069081 RepID=A0A1W1WS88_9BACT|nr:Sir2 family NAD-dependent protein deacetylase [Nitratiruptor tergarcus]SMC09164.1 NAD-dependent protein deacetylase, SIR2 family [Nitratiruptor tergarcus DSM 16512]